MQKKLCLTTVLLCGWFLCARGFSPFDTLKSYREPGSLWAALDNGVNRIELSSPLTFLDDRAGLGSAVLKIVRHKGALYFGEHTGLKKS